MNTMTRGVPILKKARARDYVFVLEDLELAFPKDQLSQITKRWNRGEELESIAISIKRNPEEVFLALFHQSRYGQITRPFAYRKIFRGDDHESS